MGVLADGGERSGLNASPGGEGTMGFGTTALGSGTADSNSSTFCTASRHSQAGRVTLTLASVHLTHVSVYHSP